MAAAFNGRIHEVNMTDLTETIENLDGVFEDPKTEVHTEEEVKDDKQEPEKVQSEPSSDKEETTVPIAALHDERRKRQEAEEKLASFEKQKNSVPMPDPETDPDGYATATKLKISISRDVIMSLDAYKDEYPDMEAHFIKMAQDNPGLVTKMNASNNPAQFAFDTAKKDKETLKLTDPDYINKLVEAEVLKRLAEGKAPSKADERKKSALEIAALTTATAQGSNSEEPAKLPELNELFAGSPF